MSNFAGSYLVHDIFLLMERYHLLQRLGKKFRVQFIQEVVELAFFEYRCDVREMLLGIGERYRICYLCLEQGSPLAQGICEYCASHKKI